MARYIDADALYRETEKKIKEANSYRMAVVDGEFLDLINDAFTADVAPRAEVEQAVAKYIVEIAETEGKKLHKKAKQEVARQIFAEIEESCSYVLQIEFGGYEHPMIKLLRNRFYDDIKRKYLEDTHET